MNKNILKSYEIIFLLLSVHTQGILFQVHILLSLPEEKKKLHQR